jgi:hypothetical protein
MVHVWFPDDSEQVGEVLDEPVLGGARRRGDRVGGAGGRRDDQVRTARWLLGAANTAASIFAIAWPMDALSSPKMSNAESSTTPSGTDTIAAISSASSRSLPLGLGGLLEAGVGWPQADHRPPIWIGYRPNSNLPGPDGDQAIGERT